MSCVVGKPKFGSLLELFTHNTVVTVYFLDCYFSASKECRSYFSLYGIDAVDN